MANKNKVLLDVDSSILERNLLLEENKDDDLNSLISSLRDQHSKDSTEDQPWKLVKPTPGFVIKTRSESGEKIFLNLCHCEEVPPPQEISDGELINILQSEEPSSYRVPISIGDLHEETDKSGVPCSVYDIAVNTAFLCKVETNQLFRSFLLTVALEGVAHKYNKEIDTNDYVILKNRKVMGTMQYHRIQKRGNGPKKMLIEEVTSSEANKRNPRFRIIRAPPQGNPENLTVQVHVKDVSSGKSLLLDVGEDRLVLRSTKKTGSLLDIFLPYSVDQDHTCAHFDTHTQILSVQLPVLM